MRIDITTEYMGMKLKNPLVASASPLSRHVDRVKRLEDAGVSAIVMHSLFEEEINKDKYELDRVMSLSAESYAEALNYLPEPDAYHNLDAEEYLEQIARLKRTLSIPVIGSLNGVSPGGWMGYARKMEQAGADAVELNIYYVPTDPALSGADVENMYVEDLKTVKGAVSIPVAVKLSPFFSNFANMALRLSDAGADGLVLFNRFYEPDFDLETLDVIPNLQFSHPMEMRLTLHWTAILFGHVKAGIAAGRGVKEAVDILKLVMAGADVVTAASVFYQEGIPKAARILEDLVRWMEAHEYESIRQMRGSMSYRHVANPALFERANYVRMLQSIR